VNAYKGEVYSQLFSVDEDVPVARNAATVSTFEKAIERVADVKDLVFAGDGTEAGKTAIEKEAHARGEGKWAIKQPDRCLAEDIARLAFLKHSRGEMENAASLKACYVRQAEAEIKLSLGLLGTKIKRSMKS